MWTDGTKLTIVQEMQIEKRIEKLKKSKTNNSQAKVKVNCFQRPTVADDYSFRAKYFEF